MARRGPHPLRFFLMILPYGASYGYIGVALPYLATHRGVSAEAIGGVIASIYLVHWLKFLWAPLVDTTLTKRAWFRIAIFLVSAGTVVTASMPISQTSLGALTWVVIASQLGLTLLGMSCEAFIGHTVPAEEKGLASDWYQTGVMIGSGVGGGAALWLAERLPSGWMVGAIVGGLMALCVLPQLGLAEPPKAGHTLGAAMGKLWQDVKEIATSRFGLTGLVIALCPVGAGAASAYFAPMADRWHASPNEVALVTGAISGVVGALGTLTGGWLADRMSRRLSYAIAGALTALCGVLLVLFPAHHVSYDVLTLAYAYFNGVAFAAFAALVFETIGVGMVASKYTLFASAANLAIWYSIKIDGRAHTLRGPTGMLLTDAALTVAGIVLLLVMVYVVRRAPQPAAAPEIAS